MGKTEKRTNTNAPGRPKTVAASSPSPITHHPSLLVPSFEVSDEVLKLASKVKLVLFDVDGVLTDARLILGDDGQEYKAFNSKDGHGIKMLQRNGVAAGIITGRSSKVAEHRGPAPQVP